MSQQRFFGEIPGVPPGTSFPTRQDLHNAGVHLPTQAGISGSADEGADSIVISGGYENDEDYGGVIIYTGEGGLAPGSNRISGNQSFLGRNKALAVSYVEQLPVRVIRGAGGDPLQSPASGFRYDGLFFVERYWEERIPNVIYRYRLVRADLDSPAAAMPTGAPPRGPAERVTHTQERIVRNFRLAEQVKRAFDHFCQVCGEQVNTPAGPYAEAAHIRPLGRPHDGPDEIGNLLCLCPNDHVRLDSGAIWIADNFRVFDTVGGALMGPLMKLPQFTPDLVHLEYHREHVAAVGRATEASPLP